VGEPREDEDPIPGNPWKGARREQVDALWQVAGELRAQSESPNFDIVANTLDLVLDILAPITIIAENAQAQVQTETAGDTMKGMLGMLELVQSEEFQEVMRVVGDVLGVIIAVAGKLIAAANVVVNSALAQEVIGYLQDFQALINSLAGTDVDWSTGFIPGLKSYLAAQLEALEDPESPEYGFWEGFLTNVGGGGGYGM
jgi:hypothetical protein